MSVLGAGFAAATGEHPAGAKRHLLGALGLTSQGEQVAGLQVHRAGGGEAAVLLDDAKAKVDRAARLQAAAVAEAAGGAQGQVANELQLAGVAEVAVVDAEQPLPQKRMGGTSTAWPCQDRDVSSVGRCSP